MLRAPGTKSGGRALRHPGAAARRHPRDATGPGPLEGSGPVLAWRMQDSNLRSIPRLIYSQLPLAARAIRRWWSNEGTEWNNSKPERVLLTRARVIPLAPDPKENQRWQRTRRSTS